MPDDVSLVAFDDIALAATPTRRSPPSGLPAFELGETAGRLLLDILAGRTVPVRSALPTQLVVRSSTGPPRAESHVDQTQKGRP